MKLRSEFLLISLISLMLAIPTLVDASSHGLDGRTKIGCNCHSGGPDTAQVNITGVPELYTPGETYELTVSLLGGPAPASVGHIGGFNLAASEGELKAPPGSSTVFITKEGESRHQMGDENGLPDNWQTTGDAVHTHEGANQRIWQVMWEAPGTGEGQVTFNVAGNSVDGDHDTPGDSWALNSYTSEEGDRSFWQMLEQNLGVLLLLTSCLGIYGLYKWMKD